MATARGELLDAAFVRELEVLRRRLEVRARSGGAGEGVARRKGSSAEFHEHRAYAPGDDLRRIDWAAYARSGEPVLKLFRAEEDVVVRLLVDGSGSLDHPLPEANVGPRKIDVGRRLAAAIGYLALARSERAQVLVGGEGLTRENLPSRGRGGLPGLLRALDAITPRGGTDLAKGIETVVRRSARPGMLVVISDFLDPGNVLGALDRAAQGGHDVALLQVVAPDEVEPTLEGDFELEDAETGQRVEVTLDASAIEAYVMRFAGLCEELRGWARRRRGTYVRARTDEAVEGVVRRFVARAVD